MTFSGVKFDQLVDWAKNDPVRLEAFRRREVDKIIEQASPETQRRLRGLQFQIDSQCRIHRSPIGRCVEISRMMQDSLQQLGSAIYGLDTPVGKTDTTIDQHKGNCANILAFPSAG